MTDHELLEQWRAGSERAGNELFDRYFVSIRRFFRNKVSSAADDLVQETFLACVQGRNRLRDDQAFRRYIFGAAHNILRVHLRRLQNGRIDFGTVSAHDIRPSPSAAVAQEETRVAVLEALRRIPLDYQVVLELFYWEEMPVADVAAIIEIPEGTAKTRLRRGRELFCRELAALTQGRLGTQASEDLAARIATGRDVAPVKTS